ncbi:Uncharacterised protein [Prevotella melaninogenica]|nr:Uncharacterised protein [Prevotella melaninogenica]
MGRLLEEFWCLRSIFNEEERTDDVGCHVVKTACEEVVNILVFACVHLLNSLFIELNKLCNTVTQTHHAVARECALKHLLHDREVGAVGDVAHGSNNLQLCCTLVDREDTCITIQTLTLVLHDETRTTMDRDRVVGCLVSILRVDTLCQWCKGISKAGIFLHFLTLFRGEFLVTCNIFQCLVDINIASSLVQERTTCIEFSLHTREHIVDSREVDNLLTELCTILSVSQALVISLLLKADRLCCDTEASTIHQRHHILDKTHSAATTELCLCILVNKFAGRRAVDTKFVLNVAYVNTAITLVIDEH